MIIRLLSFNVRGLNDKSSILMLRNYFQSLSYPDIILLQEHKLRNQESSALGKALWPQASSWALEASVGYNNDPSGPGAGKGGLITLVGPKYAHMITSSGSILENRAHWIILDGLPGGQVGIVNIYAPNDSFSRCNLWDAMIRELPSGCRWILGGDFNMVESRNDKTNPCGRMVPATERALFLNLKQHLNIDDNLRSPGSLQYSWDNFRNDGSRVMARLDRFYIFKNGAGMSNRKLSEYLIRGDNAWSDHFPISAS